LSKAERMREMQQEINRLREDKRRLEDQLYAYRKRDWPRAGDNIKIIDKRRN